MMAFRGTPRNTIYAATVAAVMIIIMAAAVDVTGSRGCTGRKKEEKSELQSHAPLIGGRWVRVRCSRVCAHIMRMCTCTRTRARARAHPCTHAHADVHTHRWWLGASSESSSSLEPPPLPHPSPFPPLPSRGQQQSWTIGASGTTYTPRVSECVSE